MSQSMTLSSVIDRIATMIAIILEMLLSLQIMQIVNISVQNFLGILKKQKVGNGKLRLPQVIFQELRPRLDFYFQQVLIQVLLLLQ